MIFFKMIWILLFLPIVFAQPFPEIGDLTNVKTLQNDGRLYLANKYSWVVHNNILFIGTGHYLYTYDLTDNGFENGETFLIAPLNYWGMHLGIRNNTLYCIAKNVETSNSDIFWGEAKKNFEWQSKGGVPPVSSDYPLIFIDNFLMWNNNIFYLDDNGEWFTKAETNPQVDMETTFDHYYEEHTMDKIYHYNNLVAALATPSVHEFALHKFDARMATQEIGTKGDPCFNGDGRIEYMAGNGDLLVVWFKRSQPNKVCIASYRISETELKLNNYQILEDIMVGTRMFVSDDQKSLYYFGSGGTNYEKKLHHRLISNSGNLSPEVTYTETTETGFPGMYWFDGFSLVLFADRKLIAFRPWKTIQNEQYHTFLMYDRYDGICDANFHVQNVVVDGSSYGNQCIACAAGKTNEPGDDISIAATSCDTIYCLKNQKVLNNLCTACDTGLYRHAGDDQSGADTNCAASSAGEPCTSAEDCFGTEVCPAGVCAVPVCAENEYASESSCKSCPPGTNNEAGDLITDTTSCDPIICTENHRVKNNICEPCGQGLLRLAGDRADRADTQCFDASTCGGVTCDPTGTEACVNHKCVCNNLFGGQDCSIDRSPAARRKQLLKARKKALPTRENLKQRQKEVKDLAREILQEEIAKGLSTKQAVKNARVEVELQDIQEEAHIVVAKLAKKPVLAVAPENKDEDDTCDQGPECASLDIAEEGDEITFLDTAEEVGSWTALANGNDIVSKQTRVSETVYDMQCWNNTWGVKTTVDVTTEGKLYECNRHIILVGSQASICTPTTCQNGGTCTVDGLSFKCTCSEGFTGEFCETSADITHCHQMDCSDFGGHKTGECTDCTVANCCNYASRTLFDAHCDTLTATQDYVNAKCCHRTYCL